MTTLNAIVHSRRIEIEAPHDFPDAIEVRVEVSLPVFRMGIPEFEWQHGPGAIAEWSAWLKTIEPIEFAYADTFDEAFRIANIEAVRKQMAGAD